MESIVDVMYVARGIPGCVFNRCSFGRVKVLGDAMLGDVTMQGLLFKHSPSSTGPRCRLPSEV